MDVNQADESAVAMIDGAVGDFLSALKNHEVKLGVADVIRLLDLRKQFAEDEISEVRVRWVESDPDPSATNI